MLKKRITLGSCTLLQFQVLCSFCQYKKRFLIAMDCTCLKCKDIYELQSTFITDLVSVAILLAFMDHKKSRLEWFRVLNLCCQIQRFVLPKQQKQTNQLTNIFKLFSSSPCKVEIVRKFKWPNHPFLCFANPILCSSINFPQKHKHRNNMFNILFYVDIFTYHRNSTINNKSYAYDGNSSLSFYLKWHALFVIW